MNIWTFVSADSDYYCSKERINKLKKIKNQIKKRKEKILLNLQKLPEVPNRKRRWCMHKRKKSSSWQRGPAILSLSGSDRRFDNIVTDVCLGTTHTSLDVALVSPFHPVAAPSRLALCWNIQDPQLNYKLTLTGLWQTSKRKLTLMEARNTKCRHIHTWKRLTYFWHFNWGIQPFQCIQEKLPHPWNGCWTQWIKESIKETSSSLICCCFFFCIIFGGLSWARRYTD